MPSVSNNPYNGQQLTVYADHTPEAIDAVLAQGHETFRSWRLQSFDTRAGYMLAAANILEARREELARLITLEMGKPIAQSRAEITKCADCCRYYATHAANLLATVPIKTEASASYLSWEPLGVVLAVMPWNFPFWQVFRFLAPTLMAGNVGVLKHASNVPRCALAIAQVIQQAGFPTGTFSTLLIESKAVADIIADPRIAAVTITGSEGAGRSVAAAAGKALKPHVLELGGSDAYVVLEDADLDHAARICAQSRMINTGQSCIAAKRFIVPQAKQLLFAEAMKRHLDKLSYGDPLEESTGYGPLARPDLVTDLHEQVQKSLAEGAQLYCGGEILAEGRAYAPTILLQVTHQMTTAAEETFGPVAAIMPYASEDEAFMLANSSRYGLGAALFTTDVARAQRLAPRLEAGCVFINDFVRSDSRLPFGGIKASGYGRELSDLGIKAFINAKSVYIS